VIPAFIIGVLLGLVLALAGVRKERQKRHTAEQEAVTHAERYRNIVDTQSELVCRFLPDTTLTFVNDAYCRFADKTREQLIGARFIHFIPLHERDRVLDRIARLHHGSDSHEHTVVLADGSEGWHQWINQAILDEHGALSELQGVGRDVTERKRAEDQLQQSETRTRAILEAVPDLMFLMDDTGTYVDYHAKDETLLWAAPSHFLGRTVRDIMPVPLADAIMAAVAQTALRDEPVVVEYDLSLPEARHFEARLVRAGNNRVLTMVRDVTDAKRLQAAMQGVAGRVLGAQEAERERIARELHDDLGQQLALLTFHVNLLAHDMARDERQLHVERLAAALAETARRIHTISYELHPSRLRLLGLPKTIEVLCQEMSQHRGVHVTFTHGMLPPVMDPEISLCVFRIAQETLSNVVRHSGADNARVDLRHENNHITLEVTDNGSGFDPHSTDIGLGLLGMRERVSLVNGHFTIDSQTDGGTRIVVGIPLSHLAAL
jgi:PAS domain S-box-containing protein